MKRGMYSDNERKLFKKVDNEHELFKYKMLSSTPKEIYDSCNIIKFYECIYEYFRYEEIIAEKHIKSCLKCGNVIASLYEVYIEYEYLRFSTFGEIAQLLDVFAGQQEKQQNIDDDLQEDGINI